MVRGIWVDPDAGRIPFREYAERWVAERPVRPRMREIYEGQLRHIVPVFANVHLCDVHPVDVRTWHGRLAASGLHHNTVAKIYRLFRSIMATAVDDGLIARNPVRIKGASAERMVERMVERPLLTWDDVRAFAGAIHPKFEYLVWTAAASGLRFGELAGLTLEHVDLEPSPASSSTDSDTYLPICAPSASPGRLRRQGEDAVLDSGRDAARRHGRRPDCGARVMQRFGPVDLDQNAGNRTRLITVGRRRYAPLIRWWEAGLRFRSALFNPGRRRRRVWRRWLPLGVRRRARLSRRLQ